MPKTNCRCCGTEMNDTRACPCETPRCLRCTMRHLTDDMRAVTARMVARQRARKDPEDMTLEELHAERERLMRKCEVQGGIGR